MQNATTLPINDSPAFLATMKLLTASNQVVGLWALPLRDKLRVLRTLALAELQARQKIKAYQQLRYWSTVPFRHGPTDVVKFSATPSPDNPSRPLQWSNPKGLQEEMIRHLRDDRTMGCRAPGLGRKRAMQPISMSPDIRHQTVRPLEASIVRARLRKLPAGRRECTRAVGWQAHLEMTR
jgi:hypothetical protein